MKENKPFQLIFNNLTDYYKQFNCPHILDEFILSDCENISDVFPSKVDSVFNGLFIALCTRGRKEIIINYRKYNIEAPSLVCILPQYVFKTISQTEDFHSEMLFISSDFIKRVLTTNNMTKMLIRINHSPHVRLSESALANLIEFKNLLIKHYKLKGSPNYTMMVKTIFFCLLLEVTRAYLSGEDKKGREDKDRKNEITNQFFKILIESHPKERGINHYADKLCITPKYLSAVVKKTTGFPVLKWINYFIISDAKSLLKMTDLTILQISEELNFKSPSFFVQFFKQNTGITPSKFRKDLSNSIISNLFY